MVKVKNQKGKGVLSDAIFTAEKEHFIAKKILSKRIKSDTSLKDAILIAKHFYDAGRRGDNFKWTLAKSLFV
jgi:hypothetical protein